MYPMDGITAVQAAASIGPPSHPDIASHVIPACVSRAAAAGSSAAAASTSACRSASAIACNPAFAASVGNDAATVTSVRPLLARTSSPYPPPLRSASTTHRLRQARLDLRLRNPGDGRVRVGQPSFVSGVLNGVEVGDQSLGHHTDPEARRLVEVACLVPTQEHVTVVLPGESGAPQGLREHGVRPVRVVAHAPQ